MALLIGFDPGGSSKKWSYVCATSDLNPDLFVGKLHEPGVGLTFQRKSFPFLADRETSSIRRCLDVLLNDLLMSAGVTVGGEGKPLSQVAETFGGIVVAVDSPSGFAIAGQNVRDTEKAALHNFNTPDEITFLNRAGEWVSEGNQTPLQQRVWWKLVGFCIYAYFLDCRDAARIAQAETARLSPKLTVEQCDDLEAGIEVIESFPTQTYEDTSKAAFSVVSLLAGRQLHQIPSYPLSKITFNRFREVLNSLSKGDRENWQRSKTVVGDVLDAFSCMASAYCKKTTGLRAIGKDLNLLRREGAIMVPA